MSYRLLLDLKKATKNLESALKAEREASKNLTRAEIKYSKESAKVEKAKKQALMITKNVWHQQEEEGEVNKFALCSQCQNSFFLENLEDGKCPNCKFFYKPIRKHNQVAPA